jgi:hypothetical protein
MHPQLQDVADELAAARARLDALAGRVPAEAWSRRPAEGRWSPAECVAHLNLTSEAFLPPLREAVERARDLDGPPPARYRRDPVGWILWWMLRPPVRLRVKTSAPFVPGGEAEPEALRADFGRLQDELAGVLEAADGLPLGKVRIVSPFDPRVRYNAYAAFSILSRHQHRHLWQAEQAAGA